MKFFLILNLILVSSRSFSVTMNWDQYVKQAAQSNPTLESAKKDWLAIRENETVTNAGFFPKLSAQTSYTRSGSVRNNSAGGAGGIVANGVILNSGSAGQINQNYLASIVLSQNVFAGFKDQARNNQAEWRSKTSFWTYVAAKATVSYSLKEAFANLSYAQESVELARTILDRRESNFNLVRVRFQNGRENKGSVLLSEAYREQAKLDLIKSEDALIVAQTKFKTLMNKDQFEEVFVEGEIPLTPLMESSANFEQLALETPTYNRAFTQEMAASEEITVARSAFIPSLDISSNVTRQGESYFPQNERWNMAVTLTIPLFDGLKDKASVNAAVLNKSSLEAQKRTALLELLSKLRDAQNQAKQGDIKFNVDLKFQQASSTRAEIARAKYNNGLLTFEDWDIIEQDLIARQTTFLQSKRDRVIKYANWENQLGRGSIQ